jgi:Ser/Thr protein kinase RdoA (MazF antagonist)
LHAGQPLPRLGAWLTHVSRVRRQLSRFPLPNPRVIGSLPASTRNDNFLIEDGLGERYVFRRYRRNPQPERIEFQLGFQQHLVRQRFPTPRVIETLSRERMVVLGRDVWALFPYIEGAEYDYRSQAQVREAARWLARFHSVGERFESQAVVTDTIPDVRRWWLDGEGELRRLEEMFSGLEVEDELDFLRGWHADLQHAWARERLDALPAAWVHGDYHGRNMVFVGDCLAGLFDFDVVHRGLRIEDVAFAVFAFAREQRESDRIRAQTARVFVDEYERHSPLTELERQALPMMAIVVQARTAPRYALRHRSGEDPVRALRAHVRRMRALHAQIASLQTTLFESH